MSNQGNSGSEHWNPLFKPSRREVEQQRRMSEQQQQQEATPSRSVFPVITTTELEPPEEEFRSTFATGNPSVVDQSQVDLTSTNTSDDENKLPSVFQKSASRSLDDNPFEMTDEKDASWIATAANDSKDMFDDSTDDFLVDLASSKGPQAPAEVSGTARTAESVLPTDGVDESAPAVVSTEPKPTDEQEPESVVQSTADGPAPVATDEPEKPTTDVPEPVLEPATEQTDEQEISFDENSNGQEDHSFFDQSSPAAPPDDNGGGLEIPKNAVTSSPAGGASSASGTGGHNRMPSAFMGSSNDDFFSSLTSDQKEPSANPFDNSEQSFDLGTNGEDMFAKSDETFDLAGDNNDNMFEKSHETFDLVEGDKKNTNDNNDDMFGNSNETFDLGGQASQNQNEDKFAFLAEPEEPQESQESQEPQEPQEPQESQKSQELKSKKSFAFLDEDDDLLLSDEDEEDNKPLASTTAQKQPQKNPTKYAPVSQTPSSFTTPVMQTGAFQPQPQTTLHSPYSPYQPAPITPSANNQNLKGAKSFINERKTGSAYDPPTDMVPKQQVRRVASFQPTVSPYAPQKPQQTTPSVHQQKPFFEELPLPPKKPPTKRGSVDHYTKNPYDPSSNQAPPPPPPPAAQQNRYSHSRTSSGGSASALSPPAHNRQVHPSQSMNAIYSPPMAQFQAQPVPVQQPVQRRQSPYAPVQALQPPMQPQQPGRVSPYAPVQQLPQAHSQQPVPSPYTPVQPPQQQQQQQPPAPSPYAPVQPPQQQQQQQQQQVQSQYAPAQPAQSPYAPMQPPAVQQSPYAPVAAQKSPVMSHVNQYGPAGTPPAQHATMSPPVNQYSPRQAPLPQSQPHQPPPPAHPSAAASAAKKPPPASQTYGDLPTDITAAIPRTDHSPPRAKAQHQQTSPPSLPPGYQGVGVGNGRVPESLNLAQQHHNHQMEMQQPNVAPPPPPPPQPAQVGLGYPPVGAAQQIGRPVSVSQPLSATDNEMLSRRQFPIFRFGTSKKAAILVPPKIAYTGGAEVRVQNVNSLMKNDDMFAKFPAPLVSKGGPVKAKKKDLEKWMDEKIGKLEQSLGDNFDASGRVEHKVIMWKLLRILLKSESPGKAMTDNLSTIRQLLVPGVPDLVKDGADDPSNFKSVNEMYQQQYRNTVGAGETKFGSEEMKLILNDIEVGNREGALRKALERRLWAHALVIAGSLGTEQWLNTVAEFVREDVRSLEPPASQSLALMYRVFSGAGAGSVSELGSGNQQRYGDSISNWKQHLCLIISNPSAKNPEAIVALGQQLLQAGLVEAAHICYILSGNPQFFGLSDSENNRVSLLGSIGESRNMDTIIASQIFEFIVFNSTSGHELVPNGLNCFPHLLAYKLVHAGELADYGYLTEAQRVCDGVLSIVKQHAQMKGGPRYNRSFLDSLQLVSERISHSEATGSGSSGGWFGGKLAKPDVNRIFSRFVTGDDDEEPQASSEKEGIFKQLNSTGAPALSRVQSHADLPSTMRYGGGGSPYAQPMPPAPDHQQLSRAQTYFNHQMSSQHHPQSRPMSPNNYTGVTAASSPGYPPMHGATAAATAPYPPQPQTSRGPSRASSVGGYENQEQISRPPSQSAVQRHQPPAPAKTPDAQLTSSSSSQPVSHAASPAGPSVPSPRKQVSASSSPKVNPYAPASAASTAPKPSGNRYAPVEASSKPAIVPEEQTGGNMYDFMYPGGGVAPPPPPAPAPVPAQEPAAAVSEAASDAAQEEDGAYQPYEPPSYGYQPPDEDVAAVDNEDLPPASGDDLFVPAPAPMFSAPQAPTPAQPPASNNSTPPTIPEENEEVEDLGFGNAKPKSEEEIKKEEEEKKKKEEKEKAGGGWFGGWFGRGKNENKAIKAKLGEENKFYYDPDLKRWVNKDAPAEAKKSSAPPPPPKMKKPSGPPSRPQTSAPPQISGSPLPPGAPSSAPVSPPPPSTPSTSGTPAPPLAGGLDDLLGAAPPPPPGGGPGAGSRKKKPARSRYVDVMQQHQNN